MFKITFFIDNKNKKTKVWVPFLISTVKYKITFIVCMHFP